jgi:hypothetical protein
MLLIPLRFAYTTWCKLWQHVYGARLDEATKPKQSARFFQWRSLPCLAINLSLCVVIMVLLCGLCCERVAHHFIVHAFIGMSHELTGCPGVCRHHGPCSTNPWSDRREVITAHVWLDMEGTMSQSFYLCIFVLLVLQLCQARYAFVGVLYEPSISRPHLGCEDWG